MAKKSFKCKDCGSKIVVKNAGTCRCENCGSIYKCYFEIKHESKKAVHTKQIAGDQQESALLTYYHDTKTA